MFREFFRYELSYRARQPATWFFFALAWIGTVVIIHITDPENGRVVNAPASHAQIVVMLNFFAMLITAGIFGDAATRDPSTRMQPLFSTAPIRKFDYLGGRFAACFLLNAVILAGMPLMVAIAYTFPWLGHFNWAPFRVATFVQPFVLFTLPNLFIAAAVAYTIAALTKNALATYLGGVGLVLLYVAVVNQGLGSDTLENLIDPFALSALQRITAYWTPIERESRLLGYPGIVVLNRALWGGVAAALLVFLHAKYSFTHPGLRLRRTVRSTGLEEEPIRHAITTVPSARREFTARTRIAQLFAVARHAAADVTRNRLFVLLVLASIPTVMAIGWRVGAIVFDTATWPVTHLMAGALNGWWTKAVMMVLIVLMAGELTWKERDVGAGDIAATAPVSDWIVVAGRLLALFGVIVTLQLVYTMAGIAVQALQGYYRFEPGLWMQMMLGIHLVDYLIVGALAVAVHVLVNQKSVGHVVMVGFLALMAAGGYLIPVLQDNLVRYNGDPGIVYSDMSGFGPFLGPWAWFKAYWASWALLLTLIAAVCWVRGTEAGARARLRSARLRIAAGAGRAMAVAAALILATGGFVFYNTHLLNEFVSVDERRARAAAYERTYGRFAAAPLPTVTANVMRVEIFPERGTADLAGHFVIRNDGDRAIDSVHVAMNRDVILRSIVFAGGARLVLDDPVLGHRIYDLASPLRPGDSTRMSFDVAFSPRGFTNAPARTQVVSNGSYFDRRWLPNFGYQASRELGDDQLRSKYGLPPRPRLPGPRDTGAVARSRMDDDGTSYVHMDVIIGTAPDHIAITPGRLEREWREAGRRYFHYVTPTPVPHGVPVLSGRYAVRTDTFGDVPLKVYYHPPHTFNIDRIVSAMQAMLAYNSATIGAYPYHELRVVEFPRYASFARAHPHTIAFGEGSAFITRIDENAGVDRPFFVIAHETAHQWWGNSLRGARLRGGALLSETLASYSALMAMEKTYGREMAWRFLGYELDRYLTRRGRGDVPLTETSTEPHVYYHKGAIAAYTLRDMIGEERMNQALRRFYETHADSAPPFPTSLDLVAELRAVTPDSLQYLITDLFETVTLWNVKTDSVSAELLPDSSWRVSLTITAAKVRADSLGNEVDVPMNDLVEIGVFAGEGDRRNLERLYLQRHRVTSGTQRIAVSVSKRPSRAAADPDHRLIQRVAPVLRRVSVPE